MEFFLSASCFFEQVAKFSYTKFMPILLSMLINELDRIFSVLCPTQDNKCTKTNKIVAFQYTRY